jgi:hypothetical protein
MSKIEVVLTAVLHTDNGILQPGETASLEEKQAKRLAALGMVQLPKKTAKSGNGRKAKSSGKAPPKQEDGGEGQDATPGKTPVNQEDGGKGQDATHDPDSKEETEK